MNGSYFCLKTDEWLNVERRMTAIVNNMGTLPRGFHCSLSRFLQGSKETPGNGSLNTSFEF